MARGDMKVGTITVRGKEYPVSLRLYGSGASASAAFVVEGLTKGRHAQEVVSETWEGLYKEAMAASKTAAAKIEFPIMEVKSGRYDRSQRRMRSGVIIGRHSGNGNLLIRWDGATAAEQDQRSYRDTRFRPLTDARAAEYLDILKREAAIEAERRKFEETYAITDLDKEVDAEIERVASETPNE